MLPPVAAALRTAVCGEWGAFVFGGGGSCGHRMRNTCGNVVAAAASEGKSVTDHDQASVCMNAVATQ